MRLPEIAQLMRTLNNMVLKDFSLQMELLNAVADLFADDEDMVFNVEELRAARTVEHLMTMVTMDAPEGEISQFTFFFSDTEQDWVFLISERGENNTWGKLGEVAATVIQKGWKKFQERVLIPRQKYAQLMCRRVADLIYWSPYGEGYRNLHAKQIREGKFREGSNKD